MRDILISKTIHCTAISLLAGIGLATAAAANTIEVPKKTRLSASLVTPINSSQCSDGDVITAQTNRDLIIGGQVAIPAGSKFSGRVSVPRIDPRLNKDKVMEIKIETVELQGQQLPLECVIFVKDGEWTIHHGRKEKSFETRRFNQNIIESKVSVFFFPLPALKIPSPRQSSSNPQFDASKRSNAMYGLTQPDQIVLLIKNGKKIKLLPGDTFEIQLIEDLPVTVN